MLTVNVKHCKNSYIVHCIGHAGFDIKGKDIVCAAASVLFINTVNSIENLTDSDVEIDQKENDIKATIFLKDDKAKVLVESMIMGMEEIQKQYKEYLSFTFEEV